MPRAQPSQHNIRLCPLIQAMVFADALRRAPAMQEVHVLVLIPSSAHCFIYADRCKIWRKEADAISRVERIISGEGTGRLWMILAEGVIQRTRLGARLDAYADAMDAAREEADAVSRAERIISGEGIGRLWMILAEGVMQRARAQVRLDAYADAMDADWD